MNLRQKKLQDLTKFDPRVNCWIEFSEFLVTIRHVFLVGRKNVAPCRTGQDSPSPKIDRKARIIHTKWRFQESASAKIDRRARTIDKKWRAQNSVSAKNGQKG
jgi:hypothetical protein